MLKVRIAVLVSGGGTNLQALIDARDQGLLPEGELALVVSSSPTAYALKRAEAAGIPCACLSKKELGGQEAFEKALAELLEREGIELIILAGFMSILGPDIISRYERRIINIHPSLIPSFCGKGFYGLKVHEAALGYGVKVTGATVHYVNEIPDGGEIILQKPVYVQPGDSPETLQRRVMEEAEWIILPQAAGQVCREILKKRS